MFLLLIATLLIAVGVHIVRSKDRSATKFGRLLLLYLLIGYCGIPMVAVSVMNLADPSVAPRLLGFPPDNPFQAFLGWAYLGMSLVATGAIRYRGPYLIGPAVVWTTFFAGATSVHLREGVLTHGGALGVFATHGLISVLLAIGLAISGELRTGGEGPTESRRVRSEARSARGAVPP